MIRDHLAAGRTALEQGKWADARSAFQDALVERETSEALEGLADACWWLCDASASVRYRERAWVRFRESGDLVRAGRAAIDLCIAYLINLGNDAAARGWLARAERVLRDTDPNPLQGWLWLMQGYMSPDAARSRALTSQALEFAQRSHDIDLELVALSDLGRALVIEGQIDDGLAMLDEALAGTLGGEYRRLDTVVFTSCSMLFACHLAGDLDRANQWCRVADEFMRTYGCPFLYARCRTHYGGVLVTAGHWTAAEDQLQAALQMSADAGPGPRMDALAQLADLRVRQGRLEEAEALLARMDGTRDVALAAAALCMARGEPAVAAGILARRAKMLGEHHIETAVALSMLVEAHIADGDLPAAHDAANRLHILAEAQDRGPAQALDALTAARIAAAESRIEEAVEELERALRRLAALDLPLERARVRLELARLLSHPRRQLAIAEAEQALTTFEQLGAATDANAAASLLRELGAPARTGAKNVGILTEREHDVFNLVALGLTNPEIAGRLYISRKTAANHVSHILAKLGLRNRAEVVAYAATQPTTAPPNP
ncbi:MAG TPA: LuxR C-terminal-related transcriptional regulator [Ilumatobacteraceae bacterium]|nr:LuxR C-terminal-related transcriptional regulator [Ilumatobacteraceae bacterium]